MLSKRVVYLAIILPLVSVCPPLRAEKPLPIGNRMIRVAWLQEQLGSEAAVQPEILEPTPSVDPSISLTQTQPTSLSSLDDSLLNVSIPDINFGSPVESKTLAQLPPERTAAIGGAVFGPSNIVLGSESVVRATTDAGDLLGSSLSNTGIYTRNESPIVTQTRIRGFRYDQIRVTNAGAAWFPIRPDFDTPLSRFDSSIVRDVITVKGPYTVRNGPGFAFIDIALADTPRNRCSDWGGYSKLLYNGNGDQWYARQSFHGGDQNSGWRIGYGHAGGSDYEAGDQSLIGASYKARDIDFAYGIDISPDSSLEFSYLRNDLTDVQLAGQINDFDYLKSDGFNLRFKLENQNRFDLLSINTWYNASSFSGGALSKTPGGGNFPGGLMFLNDVAPNPPISLVTEGDNASKGIRIATSWFGPQDNQLTTGVDYVDVDQDYRHGFIGPDAGSTVVPPVDLGGAIDFGVPLASQKDLGLFADSTVGVGDFVTLRSGTRLDFVDSTARRVVTPRPFSPPDSVIDPGADPDQSFTLFAAYLTGEFELSPVWNADVGAGYAERAPSPTELYGESPLLNIVQQGGYIAPYGRTDLNKEKLFQIDAGITGDYEFLQLGARGYHAWIDDFVTIRGTALGAPVDPRTVSFTTDPFQDPRFANTQARSWGAESYVNVNLTSQISTFGTMSYTAGRDDTIETPLWGIAPLETNLGIRWEGVASRGCPVPWGFEYSVRMVNSQDRIALGPLAPLPRGQFDPERITPAFTVQNVRGYYRVNRAVSLVAGIENIGDKLYREHLNSITDLSGGRRATRGGVLDGGVLGRGRNIYIGVQSRY